MLKNSVPHQLCQMPSVKSRLIWASIPFLYLLGLFNTLMIDKGSQYHASNQPSHTLGWWEYIYCSYYVNEIENRKEYEQVFNTCIFFTWNWLHSHILMVNKKICAWQQAFKMLRLSVLLVIALLLELKRCGMEAGKQKTRQKNSFCSYSYIAMIFRTGRDQVFSQDWQTVCELFM